MLFSFLQSISLLSQASSLMHNENKIILTNRETGENTLKELVIQLHTDKLIFSKAHCMQKVTRRNKTEPKLTVMSLKVCAIIKFSDAAESVRSQQCVPHTHEDRHQLCLKWQSCKIH